MTQMTHMTGQRVLVRGVLLAVVVLASVGYGFVMGIDVSAAVQEKAVLTTPTVRSTTITDYQILSVFVQRAAMGYDWRLRIVYLDNLGTEYVDEDTGTDAKPLVKGLNTANLSAKSLERWALERLVTKGRIPAASITGVPQ